MKLKSDFFTVVRKLQDGEKIRDWRRFRSGSRCSIQAFYNKKLGLVLKLPYYLTPETPEIFRIPTLNVVDGWVLQPLVKRNDLKLALDKITRKIERWNRWNADDIWPDLHIGNVGWYKGKPVLFDW